MTPPVEALFERYGPAYKWLATATVIIGMISVILALTIVNVAIPNIMGAMGMDQSQAQWLSTGFLAAMTAMLLANAWAVEAFGQRAAYIWSMALFVAASIVGGLAPNETTLIAARVVQGATAGIVQPLAMITVFQVFKPHERGKGMGILGLGVIIAPATSPALGGILVDLFSWRAVFFISLPLAAVGMVMGSLFMPERGHDRARPAFDWTGFGLLAVVLVALLWGFTNGQRLGWDSLTISGVLGLGVAAAVAFVLWELRCPTPLLNLRIYSSFGFVCGSVLACVLGAALYGTTYLIPLFVQLAQGLTATYAGLVLMPAGLIMAAIFPISGSLSDRVAPHIPISIGLLLVALSCFLMLAANVDTGFWTLAFWILLGRLGLGLMMPSVNAGSLGSLDMRFLAQGSGALEFARNIGGTFGVNLLSVALDRRAAFHTQSLAEELTPANPIAGQTLHRLAELYGQAGVAADLQLLAAYGFLQSMVIPQGYTRGFQDAFLLLGLVFVIALIPAWLLGRVVARRRSALPQQQLDAVGAAE